MPGNDINGMIQEALECLPAYKRLSKAYSYIAAYNGSVSQKVQLRQIYDQPDSLLEDALTSCAVDETNITILIHFLKWCDFDVLLQIQKTFNLLYINDQYRNTIRMRAKGYTLQETGAALGITRERIRQIQGKIQRQFEKWQLEDCLLIKIFAELDEDSFLTADEIVNYSGKNGRDLVFLLKESKDCGYTYSKALDAFILDGNRSEEQIKDYINGLPDYFDQGYLDRYISAGSINDELSPDLLEYYILSAYEKRGRLYYRAGMKKQQFYEAVLRLHYPNGIHIYDAAELEHFRHFVIEDFGELDLPNDRGLVARIADAGVVCGRGIYKARQKEYISIELAKRIADFIRTNESPVLPIHYVYRCFQKQLNENGVDNHYYLHGILHELFDGRFYINRDYVSKSKKVFRIQPMIRDYILSSKKPVSHDDVVTHIPGVSQIVEYMATDVPEILKYHGGYMFVGNIVISEKDQIAIRKYISSKIKGGAFCNNRDVYAWLQVHCSQFLRDNYICDQFSCYSVLEYLFNKYFQFVRPFIGAFGAAIARPYERLQEYLRESDEIDVKEFAGYLKENGINNRSTLAIINENNDSVFIYTNGKLLAVNLLGIDEQIAVKVEAIVCPHVQETMAIRDLPCFMQLPPINVAWTDWLVYSTLRKWSKKLDVGETTNKINYAVPLIAPAGMLDVSAVSVDARQQDSFEADNLDNLDDLLEDLIEWDDLETD